MKKHCVLVVLLYLIINAVQPITANPFTGTKDSPPPIYHQQGSKENTEQQRILHEKLGSYLYEWTEHKSISVLITILLISVLYGLLHAMGPGHRKTVVFSFYLARKAPAYEPLLIGMALAFIHGGTAIILMIVFKGITGAVSGHTHDTSIYMEGFSFILLTVLSVYSLIHSIHHITGKAHCCHHHHHKKARLGMLLLSSVYPCPAIIMVAVLSASLNILPLGIACAVSMSVGMSIPITTSAYLAWAGREGLFKKFKQSERQIGLIGNILEILGYSILLYISARAAIPFVISFFA